MGDHNTSLIKNKIGILIHKCQEIFLALTTNPEPIRQSFYRWSWGGVVILAMGILPVVMSITIGDILKRHVSYNSFLWEVGGLFIGMGFLIAFIFGLAMVICWVVAIIKYLEIPKKSSFQQHQSGTKTNPNEIKTDSVEIAISSQSDAKGAENGETALPSAGNKIIKAYGIGCLVIIVLFIVIGIIGSIFGNISSSSDSYTPTEQRIRDLQRSNGVSDEKSKDSIEALRRMNEEFEKERNKHR